MQKLVLFFVLVFVSVMSYAQTNEAAPVAVDAPNVENFNLLQQSTRTQNNGTPSSNTVLIQQVGVANSSFVNVISTSSIVQVSQKGNRNNVNIALRGNNINERIIQRGSNNSVVDRIPGFVNGAGLDVVQNGRNLSLVREGSNELTNNIKVRQFGNGNNQNPIIIRSFR